MTLEQWLSQWISLRVAGLAPRTIESYHDLVRLHIAPVLGTVSVDSVSADQITALLAALCAAGHTRTAQLCYVLLRAALADAARCGRIARSPMELVLRPRHYAQQRAYLGAEDLRRLVTWCAANPGQYTRAWLLASLLGLRRGEIAGLRWVDVDISQKVIHIRNQRQRVAGQLLDSPPKSRAGIRDIPLPPLLLSVLRQARGIGYVVPVDPAQLDHQIKIDLEAADVPAVTLHGLRHSMATAAMRSGCSLRVLQTILGHASASTTANIYQHVELADKSAALDALQESCYTGFVSANVT